ncbi:hypothetical protein LY76DRAFT_598755 [Colletotrichum caudatum]|nr:hypothetical protein LY76DRAFT_598755 [Colletotrichum caudatum]
MQRLCRADRLAAASETLQAWLVDEMEVRSRLLESGEVNWEDVDKGIAHIKQGACWQWNWLAEYDASRNAKGGGGGSDGDGDGGVTTFALSLNRLGCSGAGLHRQLIGDLHAALNKDYAELQRLMALVAETKRCGEESLGCAPDELEKIVAGYRGFATRLYCKDH